MTQILTSFLRNGFLDLLRGLLNFLGCIAATNQSGDVIDLMLPVAWAFLCVYRILKSK
jgi:hypothetical protein